MAAAAAPSIVLAPAEQLDLNVTRKRRSLVNILRTAEEGLPSPAKEMVVELIACEYLEGIRPVSCKQSVILRTASGQIDPRNVKETVNVWIAASGFIGTRETRIINEEAAPEIRAVDIPVI